MKDRIPNAKNISSSENGKYKGWTKLLTKKYREKERAFLVEGELLISDALKSGGVLRELIVREGYDFDKDLFPDNILKSPSGDEALKTQKYFLDGKLFDKLSQTENGRSVIGVFEIPNVNIEDWEEGDIVVLDRLQDPGNLGTIIRTADAAAVSGIITMKGTTDPFSPKASRSAAGSIFRIPIIEAESAEELKTILSKLNATPAALDLDGAVDHYDMPDKERFAFIVGNEGGGVSEDCLAMSEIKIKIPMREGIESLNAAMAFGIVIYERVRRKCRKS